MALNLRWVFSACKTNQCAAHRSDWRYGCSSSFLRDVRRRRPPVPVTFKPTPTWCSGLVAGGFQLTVAGSKTPQAENH
jgi:hypothetical protein